MPHGTDRSTMHRIHFSFGLLALNNSPQNIHSVFASYWLWCTFLRCAFAFDLQLLWHASSFFAFLPLGVPALHVNFFFFFWPFFVLSIFGGFLLWFCCCDDFFIIFRAEACSNSFCLKGDLVKSKAPSDFLFLVLAILVLGRGQMLLGLLSVCLCLWAWDKSVILWAYGPENANFWP